MFELYAPEKTVVMVATRRWATGEPMKLVRQMVADGYPVWVRYGKQRHVLLPNGMSEQAAKVRAEAAWSRRTREGANGSA